ncbi:MAG: 50S ribosomal protein L18e [Halobacteriota archaeon]
MAKHSIRKTNPELMLQIDAFKAHARQHQANIWRDIARRLEAPSNNYAKVNLSRLNRHTNSGDIVVVAGKVLGAGSIDHPISIGAPSFSDSARSKILAVGGTVLSLDEIAHVSPKGSHVKIIR